MARLFRVGHNEAYQNFDALPFWVYAVKEAAKTFTELAERFQEAPRRSRNPSVLKRDIHGALAIQAGKLLCECCDGGAFLWPRSCGKYKNSERDLRTRSPSVLRERAIDVVWQTIQGKKKIPGYRADRQRFKAAVAALTLPGVRSAGPVEFTYVWVWLAFIRWQLIPRHQERFRADWKEQFAPQLDQLRPADREVNPKALFKSPVSEDPKEAALWRLDVSADVQATACKILAEELCAELRQARRTTAGGKTPAADAQPAQPVADKEALALAVLAKHPDWSDADIAKQAGCSRTSLYRWPKYVQAREILEQGKHRLASGAKDQDGRIEAWR
jgi:hypothetical protein